MITVMDVETTIAPPKDWKEGESLLKGGDSSPYNPFNSLVSVHYFIPELNELGTILIEDNESLQKVQQILTKTKLLVGFNIKFDLSWLYSSKLQYNGDIYDCQLAEYLLSGGTLIQPSLDNVAVRYGLDLKSDKVKAYWQKGINTDAIPEDVIKEYGEKDVIITERVYKRQQLKIGQV